MDKPYLGQGWAFPPHFKKGRHAETVMVKEDEDIKQSLAILFSTLPGERIFRFFYGCNIRQWVFSNMNVSEKTLITDTIEQAIIAGEPRILLESVAVNTTDEHDGVLSIEVYYTVKATNSRSNMVFPFYFKEGTSLNSIPERD